MFPPKHLRSNLFCRGTYIRVQRPRHVVMAVCIMVRSHSRISNWLNTFVFSPYKHSLRSGCYSENCYSVRIRELYELVHCRTIPRRYLNKQVWKYRVDMLCHSLSFTGMRSITTLRSTTDRIYDSGPIRLYYNTYNRTIFTIVLQIPTVFNTVTCCTDL
jgi:hypothetical protein